MIRNHRPMKTLSEWEYLKMSIWFDPWPQEGILSICSYIKSGINLLSMSKVEPKNMEQSLINNCWLVKFTKKKKEREKKTRDVVTLTLSIRLHSRCCVDSIAKQTVSGHFQANHTSTDWTCKTPKKNSQILNWGTKTNWTNSVDGGWLRYKGN